MGPPSLCGAYLYLCVVCGCRNKQGLFPYAAITLGAFTELRKATISCVMSVRPHGTIRLPLDAFLMIFDI